MKSYNQKYPFDIFLCYARSDNKNDQVSKLRERLTELFYDNKVRDLVFFQDVENFTGIGILNDLLKERVGESALFMLVSSENSSRSEWCHFEFHSFFKNDSSFKRILEVKIDHHKSPFPKEIRSFSLALDNSSWDNNEFNLLYQSILEGLNNIKNNARRTFLFRPPRDDNENERAIQISFQIKEALESNKFIVVTSDSFKKIKTTKNNMTASSHYVQYFDSVEKITDNEKRHFQFAIEMDTFTSITLLYVYEEGKQNEIINKLLEGDDANETAKLKIFFAKREKIINFVDIPHYSSEHFSKELKIKLNVEMDTQNKHQDVKTTANQLYSKSNFIITEKNISENWMESFSGIIDKSGAPNFFLFAKDQVIAKNIIKYN